MASEDQGGPVVLLVEEEAELRGAIASALRQDGHEVLEMGDATRLLAHLTSLAALGHRRRESLCIVAEEGTAVNEVLQMLRSARWPTPVVLLAPDDERGRTPALGAVATLSTPPDVDRLRSVVRNAIRPALMSRGGASI